MDDFHNSSKMMWKTRGKIRIVHIPVIASMMSLQTGKGYLADLKQRFMQAERHMHHLLQTAYNFNMLAKEPFRWRTLWSTLYLFDNTFFISILYLNLLMMILSKFLIGVSFSSAGIILLLAL